MMNLLLPEDKAKINKEFLRRFIVVVGALLFVLIMVEMIFLLSLFFSLDSSLKNFKFNLIIAEQEANTANLPTLEAEIERLNYFLDLFQKGKNEEYQFSSDLIGILEILPSSVNIKSFLFDRAQKSDEYAKITISGRADTRSNLLFFINQLKSVSSFVRVESPVSNLLTEENIDFTLFVYLNDKREIRK